MELDAKQKVLMAIYAEYQKDVPVMQNVTFGNLDMDSRVFKIAVDKLENEVLITGAKIHYKPGSGYPDIVTIDLVKMTLAGIEFVETKMELDHGLTGKEKLEVLSQKWGKLGWEVLNDFTAKVLAEMAKQTIS